MQTCKGYSASPPSHPTTRPFHCCHVCAFFTLYRSFYPSTSNTPSFRADSSSLPTVGQYYLSGSSPEPNDNFWWIVLMKDRFRASTTYQMCDLVATGCAILSWNSARILINRHLIGPGLWRHETLFVLYPKHDLVVKMKKNADGGNWRLPALKTWMFHIVFQLDFFLSRIIYTRYVL